MWICGEATGLQINRIMGWTSICGAGAKHEDLVKPSGKQGSKHFQNEVKAESNAHLAK